MVFIGERQRMGSVSGAATRAGELSGGRRPSDEQIAQAAEEFGVSPEDVRGLREASTEFEFTPRTLGGAAQSNVIAIPTKEGGEVFKTRETVTKSDIKAIESQATKAGATAGDIVRASRRIAELSKEDPNVVAGRIGRKVVKAEEKEVKVRREPVRVGRISKPISIPPTEAKKIKQPPGISVVPESVPKVFAPGKEPFGRIGVIKEARPEDIFAPGTIGFVAKQKMKLEQFAGLPTFTEEGKLIEKKPLQKLAGFGAVAISPFVSKEKLERIGISGLVGTLGGTLAAAGGGALVAAGATVLLVSDVPRLQKIFREPDPAKRAELIAEETANIAAAVGFGFGGAKVARAKGVVPERVEVTKIKGKKVALIERADVETGIRQQELGVDIKKQLKKTRTRVKPFIQEVTPPKDAGKLQVFSTRKDVRAVFGLEQKPAKGLSIPKFFLEVPAKIRQFRTKPEPFLVRGKTGAVFEVGFEGKRLVLKPKEQVEISRIIEPEQFKIQEVPGDRARLTRELIFKPEPESPIKRAELGGVLDIVKTLRGEKRFVFDFFKGKKAEVTSFKPIKPELPKVERIFFELGGKEPIIGVRALKAPTPTVLLPQPEVQEPRTIITPIPKIEPVIKTEPILETEPILKQEPILDIEPIVQQKPIVRTQPIIDIEPIIEREPVKPPEPIFDVEPIQELEPLIEPILETPTKQRFISDLPVPPKETIVPPLLFSFRRDTDRRGEERFEGFNVVAKAKGKFKKLNKTPLTRNAARDLGAEVVDKSISARFKVTKMKKLLSKPPKNGGTGYFSRNMFKFRNFRADKFGNRVGPLTMGEMIERRKFRLDKKEETQSIQQALRKSKSIRKKPGELVFGNFDINFITLGSKKGKSLL